MRTVTGARKGTSHELLYKETNWSTLADRRNLNKLKYFIKIVNNDVPVYVRNLLPKMIGTNRPMSRNADNFYLPKSRTETFRSSFIPATTKLWNNSLPEQRTIEYTKQEMSIKPNKLYYLGNRKVNVQHAQLRMHCSKLNAHLFSLHVTDSPHCACGYDVEDNEHYLFDCPIYILERWKMFTSLQIIIQINDIQLEQLLYGSKDHDFTTNKSIFEIVHTFLTETGRL